MEKEEETRVRDLLSSWGLLTEVQDKFVENFMDLYAIERMDRESITALLGPAQGLRIRFEEHRKEWIQSRENQTKICIPVQNIASDDLNGDAWKIPILLMEDNEMNLISQAASQQPLQGSITEGESTSDSDSSVLKTLTFDVSHDQKTSPPPVKKTKSYDIDSALKSSTKGTTVLKIFEKEKSFSKDSLRDTVVECIIEHELSNNMQQLISRDRLKILAQEIVNRFPGENILTYFQVYVHPKTKKSCAKGKLVWKYYNVRRKLLDCGAIVKGEESTSSEVEVTDKTPGLRDFVMDKNIKGGLSWLEEYQGGKVNWEEVTSYWRKTSMARMTLLIRGTEVEDDENEVQKSTKGRKGRNQKGKNKIVKETAHQYMSKYRVFQENSAYMLFEIDFHTLRPQDNVLALYSSWSTLSAFIIQELKKKEPNFLDDPLLTNSEKTLLTLLNFSKLFPIVTCSLEKRGKKVWRPSHAEVADAFVYLAPCMLDLERVKDERRDRLRTQNLSLQPFVAVIGPKANPQQYLVCVDDFFYEVNSVLQAVDVTFKCFFAIDTPYPTEAEQIWLFLQKGVYGFSTEVDGNFTGVISMLDQFKIFKENLSKPTKE